MASRRKHKPREDPLMKLALSITTPEQARHGVKEVDVANYSEADQRHSVRAKETKTVRKLTRVERFKNAGVITAEQAAACEAYLEFYELGFQTVGCTANYTGAGGGGFGSSDLFARYKAQAEARENYYYARAAIPTHLVGLFERALLHTEKPFPSLWQKQDKLRFSLAAFLLHGQIGHMLLVAA